MQTISFGKKEIRAMVAQSLDKIWAPGVIITYGHSAAIAVEEYNEFHDCFEHLWKVSGCLGSFEPGYVAEFIIEENNSEYNVFQAVDS